MLPSWPGFFPTALNRRHMQTPSSGGFGLDRILMGILSGMGLAIAGAASTGHLEKSSYRIHPGRIFRSRLRRSPGHRARCRICGRRGYLVIGNAFIFTLIASFTVYGLAKYKGITPETLILAGIAIMYLFSAMTSTFCSMLDMQNRCRRSFFG